MAENSMQVRFPHSSMTLIGMLCVVGIAFAHSFYTWSTLQQLSAQGQVSSSGYKWMIAMFTLTIVLTVFVQGALLARRACVLSVDEEGWALKRWHWRVDSRRLNAPHSETRVRLESNWRGQWRLGLDAGRELVWLPLYEARVTGQVATNPRSKAEAQVHWLVKALEQRTRDDSE